MEEIKKLIKEHKTFIYILFAIYLIAILKSLYDISYALNKLEININEIRYEQSYIEFVVEDSLKQ